jgi:hypothetical protein
MATITLRSSKGSPLTNSEVDANFTNLNNDKYESGDNIVADDLSSTGEVTMSAATTITAAGATQGAATAMTKTYNVVTTATADQGVKLPSAGTGKQLTVVNATSVTIKVYPAAGEQINSLSANAAKSLAAGATMDLVCTSGTAWKSLEQVLIFDSAGSQLN